MSKVPLPDFSSLGYKTLRRFGTSSVFLVESLENKKKYALKRLTVGSDGEAEKEFKALRELRGIDGVMKLIECKQYASQRGDVFACLILEYCENGNVASYIADITKRNTLFSEGNLISVIRQIYEALSSLHAVNSFHRNLAPENIYFRSPSKVVLGGMKQSKPFGPDASQLRHTNLSGVRYAAPEMVDGTSDQEAGVDMWGLGIVILELCRVPHVLEGTDRKYVYQRICPGDPKSTEAEYQRIATELSKKGYSSELIYLTKKLLEVDPKNRYCISEIENFLSGNAGGKLPDYTPFGYKCLSQIGAGGMARVFMVESLKNGQRFALKQTLIKSDDDMKEASKERDVLTTLQHPNIVKFYESFMRESREEFLCIVMELCRNSLDSIMAERNGEFDEETIITYLHQICSAMEHLHSLKIFHRDITPRNILFSEDGVLKLGDFGISNTFGDLASNPRCTRIGTPNYVSPEVFGGASQSGKIDMWGIGAITIELCGMLKLNESVDLHLRVREDQAKVHENIRYELSTRNYSKPLIELCVSLLQFNPEDRPSAEEVLHKLKTEF
eukprot:TRINITY_DN1996_c1_g1_i1.p1 TRINITY_DN1996_c1_g1~~TRINITY_DN1996_c1_g1_i1.p1  ORF type:complete len:558 (+),score=101.77 TRINITY_DN1996_c1_g1_i1:170-1843(+)